MPTKVRLVKAMVFPMVMYGCENWTVKKAERGSAPILHLYAIEFALFSSKTLSFYSVEFAMSSESSMNYVGKDGEFKPWSGSTPNF